MAEKITENKFADRICTARRHLAQAIRSQRTRGW
jgi:hypothetical protein